MGRLHGPREGPLNRASEITIVPSPGSVTLALDSARSDRPPASWHRIEEPLTSDPVSQYIARLWARDESRRLAIDGEVDKAVALGVAYRIVTPVTGAIVLETNKQYERNRLDPAQPSDVMPPLPGAPVPEWSTLLLVGLGLTVIAVVRRRA